MSLEEGFPLTPVRQVLGVHSGEVDSDVQQSVGRDPPDLALVVFESLCTWRVSMKDTMYRVVCVEETPRLNNNKPISKNDN
jgi:hypothetical protein